MERKRSDDPGEINALLKVPALKNLNREKEKSLLSLCRHVFTRETHSRGRILTSRRHRPVSPTHLLNQSIDGT
jgi:hypothetical protein